MTIRKLWREYSIPIIFRNLCITSSIMRKLYLSYACLSFPFQVSHLSLPMSLARTATGLRSSVTNFLASSLISMTLLSRAKRGASGNEATKRETKPNWMTGEKRHNHRTRYSRCNFIKHQYILLICTVEFI